MSETTLPLPLPVLDGPHQPGITDPTWPAEPPFGFDAGPYEKHYAGRIERQRHLHIVTADIAVPSRAALRETLQNLSRLADLEMRKHPPDPERPFDPKIDNRRVTITIGLGGSLFTTVQGDDRFGIAGLKPSSLKVIPQIAGDAGFLPRDVATDLIFLLASDDIYVNEYLLSLLYYRAKERGIHIRGVERGYARPDSREPSGFEDGVTNPRGGTAHSPMDHFVYIQSHDDEPAWCRGGTYLAYRKIRRRLAKFFSLSHGDREAVFGVHADTGNRMSSAQAGSHVRKMNPRRPGHRDLFDIRDEERHMLRRPYFFDDGFDAEGNEVRGIHHLAFARNLVRQYEWPVLMWQTNPDFPKEGAGIDALYSAGGAANLMAAYYFMPPAPTAGSYLGAELVE